MNPDARIEVVTYDNSIGSKTRAGLILMQIMGTKPTGPTAKFLQRGHWQGRNWHRICLYPVIDNESDARPIGSARIGGLRRHQQEIATKQRKHRVRETGKGRAVVPVGYHCRRV